MNVLILTPDAVGSTLLQRTLTIYMQFYEFDRPVINLHELTNGLAKFYSPEFNQELVGKKNVEWNYHQSLLDITSMLNSVDHYKTSRLAYYHIRARQDSIQDQVQFYNYLNENFYIISCRRKNIFEHALSWTINKITKKLNVYSTYEKVDTFLELYKNPLTIDPLSLIDTLNRYRGYLDWCDNFQIASYFEYETHVPDIENFILNLPFMSDTLKQKTFKDVYGLTFNDWNKTHYYTGDIGSMINKNLSLANDQNQQFLPWESESIQLYNRLADPSWPTITNPKQLSQLPERIKTEIKEIHNVDLSQVHAGYSLSSYLPDSHREFIDANKTEYLDALQSMKHMETLGILPSSPPMKKQTLNEKKMIVKNFQELVDAYNNWQQNNSDIAQPFVEQTLLDQQTAENNFWNPSSNLLN